MTGKSCILTAIAGIFVGGLLTSCASTRVAGAWKVPAVAQVAPRRVLVLAVLGNATSRRAVEDEVVRQLGQVGADAILGYSISPDTADIPRQRLAEILAGCGADAALVCRWHLVRQTALPRAGSSSGPPSGERVQQMARGDAALLAGSTLGTLWFAATTSDQPGGFRDAAPGFAKALVSALLSDGALSCDAKVALLPTTEVGIAACSRALP